MNSRHDVTGDKVWSLAACLFFFNEFGQRQIQTILNRGVYRDQFLKCRTLAKGKQTSEQKQAAKEAAGQKKRKKKNSNLLQNSATFDATVAACTDAAAIHVMNPWMQKQYVCMS